MLDVVHVIMFCIKEPQGQLSNRLKLRLFACLQTLSYGSHSFDNPQECADTFLSLIVVQRFKLFRSFLFEKIVAVGPFTLKTCVQERD